jgi:DNA-binding PadR family transcriptional regulator
MDHAVAGRSSRQRNTADLDLQECFMTGVPELDRLLPLTTTVFHVLGALAHGPKHGYGVAREVEALSQGRIVMGPGTLYGSLQRMTETGLIEETDNPGEDGLHAERRRYYRVTALGRAALRAEATRLARTLAVVQERMG